MHKLWLQNTLFCLAMLANYSLVATQTLNREMEMRRLQKPLSLNAADYLTPAAAVAAGFDVDFSPNDLPLDFNHDGRIIGGQVTSILNYPFVVSLQYHKSHICGGSILTPNIILTAAHCIESPQDVASFQVRVGSSYHLGGGQVVAVRQIIKHPAYNLNDLDCDVALVRLSKNLTFSRLVRPIALPEYGDEIPDKQPLFVSGWGLTSETGSVVSMLNHVAVNLMNHSICEESYRYVATITGQMFCAGLPEGGKDSCQGDSGGPLVSYASSPSSTLARPSTAAWPAPTRPTQYGIVSFGVGCAHKGYPGVYTNVAALRPWIDERIKEMTDAN